MKYLRFIIVVLLSSAVGIVLGLYLAPKKTVLQQVPNTPGVQLKGETKLVHPVKESQK